MRDKSNKEVITHARNAHGEEAQRRAQRRDVAHVLEVEREDLLEAVGGAEG